MFQRAVKVPTRASAGWRVQACPMLRKYPLQGGNKWVRRKLWWRIRGVLPVGWVGLQAPRGTGGSYTALLSWLCSAVQPGERKTCTREDSCLQEGKWAVPKIPCMASRYLLRELGWEGNSLIGWGGGRTEGNVLIRDGFHVFLSLLLTVVHFLLQNTESIAVQSWRKTWSGVPSAFTCIWKEERLINPLAAYKCHF